MNLGLINPNDPHAVRRAFQTLQHDLGYSASPTLAGLTLTGLTASQFVMTDASKGLVSLAVPLLVDKGGTGLTTITNHGLLLGSGTDAITPLAAASNGQLPIGSTGADPVLATLTGTADEIEVTNAAGSITLSLAAAITIGGLTTEGDINIGGDILPDTDNTYDIGHYYDAPLAELVDSYNAGYDNQYAFYGVNWAAQTWTTTATYIIVSAKLRLYRIGIPGDITMNIQGTVAGKPDGSTIATCTISGNAITTDADGEWVEFDLGDGATLDTGTVYAIVMSGGVDVSNRVTWKSVLAGGYGGGTAMYSTNGGDAWALSDSDCMFETYRGDEDSFLRFKDIYLAGDITDGTNATSAAEIAAAYAHISESGASHTYINQNVTTTGSPQFSGLGIGEASVGSGEINITGSGDEIRRVDMENTSDGAYARAGFIARADAAEWVMDAFGSGHGTNANDVRLTGMSSTEFLIWARRIGDAGDYPDLRFLAGSIELTFVAADSSVTLDNAYLGITNNNELRFYDDGANYVGFEAPALDANQIWVLPDADGGAGELLRTDGAGNLGWTATAPPGAHVHDGDTLQLDAINSDAAGGFAFDTAGVVTFNSGVTLGVGADLTINSHILFTTDNSYIGFTDANLTFNDTDDTITVTGGLVVPDLTVTDLTVTNCAVLGSNSAVFQPAADSTSFFQVKNAAGTVVPFNVDTINNQVTMGYTSATYPFKVLSTNGSNYAGLYHDNSNIYLTTDDGDFIFRTSEAGDKNSVIRIQPKGSDFGYGQLQVYDQDLGEYVYFTCWNGTGSLSVKGTAPVKLSLQTDGVVPITMFATVTEGKTPLVSVYGFGNGFGGKESLDISVEQYAANTADFMGLDAYMFGGNLITKNFTHEDTDGGRESIIYGKGEQGVTPFEEGTLGSITFAHDGTGEDYKGKITLSTNANGGADTLVDAVEIDSAQNVIVGDGTNQAIISHTGVLTLEGTARRWQSQDLKPGYIKHPAASPPDSVEYQNRTFDAYDDTAEEQVFYIWHLPNNFATGTASVRGHFGGMVSNEAGAEYVAMGFEYWKFSPGDTYDTSGAADGGGSVNITIANGEENYVWHESATGYCDTTEWAKGDIVVFRFFRDVDGTYTGGDGEAEDDDYTGDVLIGVYHLEYLRDSLGSS